MRNSVLLVFSSLFAASCASIDRAAVRTAAGMLEKGRVSTLEEPDWRLGRDAAAAQLKLIEGLIVSEPESLALRRMAAEGFSGYAFLFVEDEEPARAKGLYLRARDHALAGLAAKDDFKALSARPLDDLEARLKRAERTDVADLYWAAFGWAGWINLSKDDAAALAELPKAVAMMKRVYELDPAFQFGGADLFFGVYYASRPPILGGDPGKAKTHFEWAHKITKGSYLMTHVLNARWYAVAVQDRELFKQLLTKVASSPSGVLPEARLTDEAAKRKAAALLEKIDDFF